MTAAPTPGPTVHGDRREPESVPAGPPVTGDLVIDAALAELAAVAIGDAAGHLEVGERVQRALQGRLADLGG